MSTAVFFNIMWIAACSSHKEQPVKSGSFTRTVPADFLNLFSPATKKLLTIAGTNKTVSGLPVSSVIYTYPDLEDRHDYIIQLFKIGLRHDAPLSLIINAGKSEIQSNADTTFTTLREGGFDLKYKDGRPNSITKVTLTVDGDVLKLNTQTDSLQYYDVKFAHFILKYDNGSIFTADKTTLFFGQTGKFIFIKRNQALYTIFISNVNAPERKTDTVLSLLNYKLPK